MAPTPSLTPQELWSDVEKVRSSAPLVHSITNHVVMNLNANVLLAAGASPVMAHAHEEVVDMAGIAQAYPDPASLVGKRIVVVANLAPRPLRGITSQGMLLAAGEAPDLQVVTVGDAIAPGTRVK